MYAPLRVHGWHSFLTGVDAPEVLLERAAELGLPSLALTDVDNLAGSTEFLQAAARGRERGGPRPILGAEISDPAGRPGRLVALVRTEEGYRNLARLVSARQLGDDPGTAGADLPGPAHFDPVDAAVRFAAGLTYVVDHPRLVFALAGRIDPERLFVAVSPAALEKRGRRAKGERPGDDALTADPGFDRAGPKVPPPARAVAAHELVASAQATGLATLAVPDVHWARAGGFEHHRVRTAIKHNALTCDLPDDWLADRPGHLLAPEEMRRLYARLPEVAGPFRANPESGLPGALARTLAVAETCRFVPTLGGVLFPDIELGPDETAYSRLCELAFDGARRRFAPLKPEVLRRLDQELTAIDTLGYAAYFLLVKRIADYARGRAIPCVGRGSAADSLVAYCLDLTDADPLRYRLPFERFLNPARRDRPDIDLDFCWRRRDEVIEHVWEAFGAERTAMIATLNRFGLRAAFREAALTQGIPPVEVNRWSRRLPWMVSNAHDGSEGESAEDEAELSPDDLPAEPQEPRRAQVELPAELAGNPVALAFASTPECRDFPFDDPRYGFVLKTSAALLDAPRHLGLHPGGVVVAPGAITDVTACQRASKGVVMTQLDKHGVEALGLVKMDLLGNRALTVVDDCLGLIRDVEGREPPDIAQVLENDERTGWMLEHGRTLACFQVESPGMRHLLQQTGAKTMDDVIQAVALIRPGPAGSGMKDAYVRRFRGLEAPLAPHPRLQELLWDTHGVMLYQEDVMQVVALLAGFELSTADELRRALAKRRTRELDILRARYFQGCDQSGVERADAERVWALVENFSSFGFCKAHAVTYGRIAYRTVYLKAHHPAAFMTAFLNSQTGYYETRVYIEEARRMGVPILPPDVNKSVATFSLEPAPNRAGPEHASAGIRVGLDRVKGLTEHTRRAMLDERARGGPYLSLPDFLARSGARRDETEKLVLCGAFDAFDRTRPEMLWRLHLVSSPPKRAPQGEGLDPNLLAACRTSPEDRARESARDSREATGGWSRGGLGLGGMRLEPGQTASLFAEPATPALALPPRPEMDEKSRGLLELELLGLTVCNHPTQLFPSVSDERRARLAAGDPVPCATIPDRVNQRVCLRGWLAASRRVRTADHRWMRFLTLEDPSGLAEVVLFPDVYERDGHRLTSRGPFLLAGRVHDQMGACTLHAERVF